MNTPVKRQKIPGSGRQKGTPDKKTHEARQAIGMFVDANAHRLQGWLDQIAEGRIDPENPDKFIIRPDPEKAFSLFQSVIEYHVPKLARTETKISGELGVKDLTDDQLTERQTRLLEMYHKIA